MNALETLTLRRFRRFDSFACTFHPSLNVIVGPNGAGKTTILEAIGFFGLGKSFRTPQADQIFQMGHTAFSVKIGYRSDEWKACYALRREKHSPPEFFHEDKRIHGLSTVVRQFPTQFFLPTTLQWFQEASQERRTALDWGCFYCYPNYKKTWLMTQRLLRQRNALLKLPDSMDSIAWWDQQLCIATCELSRFRETYLQALQPIACSIWQILLPDHTLKIEFKRGWSQQVDYLTCLSQQYARDKLLGYTTQGAHRADVLFQLLPGGLFAQQFLSRGELKLFLFGFKLAQAILLSNAGKNRTLYLIDDLTSELDRDSFSKVMALLLQYSHVMQTIFTDLSATRLKDHFQCQEAHWIHLKA